MICAFSGCENEFEPNEKKRKKYCSYECSVKANNKRTMERYNERKKRLNEPQRKCATQGCPTILRRTNDEDYCDPCMMQHSEDKKAAFRNLVLNGE